MVDSTSFSRDRAIKRVMQLHRWMDQAPKGYFNYIPTVIVGEMIDWPEITDLLRHETAAHKISPQIHGLHHVDYGSLDKETIREHLGLCMTWFKDTLWYEPTIWATPWGGWSRDMEEVASEFNLTLETTRPTISIGRCIDLCKTEGVETVRYSSPLVLIHWWEKGLKLLRLTEIVKNGSYEAAVVARPDLFGDMKIEKKHKV
jgi:peptidoglycan/xylan/chitin deacetylase (PgdA/CDA1 family)